MKILVAFDSFKGSLSAQEACRAFRQGFKKDKNFNVEALPLADGGEGTSQILAEYAKAEKQVIGMQSFYFKQNCAYAEIASANPWKQSSPAQESILDRNSSQTGELIKAVSDSGAKKLVLGLGGSGTHDAGIGLLKALGFRFLDEKKEELEALPRNLLKLDAIERPKVESWPEIIALCDVNAPIVGNEGSVQNFSEQKGAKPEERVFLEKAFEHLAKVADRKELSTEEKTGAAGGMAFALKAFLGAKLQSGFNYVAKDLNLREHISSANWVISGEGRLDKQTLEGKVIGALLELCKKEETPLQIVCGQSELSRTQLLEAGLDKPIVLSEIFGEEKSMNNPANCLMEASRIFAKKLPS